MVQLEKYGLALAINGAAIAATKFRVTWYSAPSPPGYLIKRHKTLRRQALNDLDRLERDRAEMLEASRA